MFGWLKKGKRLEPEARWQMAILEDAIGGTDQTGAQMYVPKDELSSVVVETNDTGPWGADLWWLLFGKEGRLSVAFPQGATGEDEILEYLMALPGFDEKEMTKAMGSTSNDTFLVWQRRDEAK